MQCAEKDTFSLVRRNKVKGHDPQISLVDNDIMTYPFFSFLLSLVHLVTSPGKVTTFQENVTSRDFKLYFLPVLVNIFKKPLLNIFITCIFIICATMTQEKRLIKR